jgi:hypothetical protein
MSKLAVYHAGTIKRKRRTNNQIEQLDNQIIEALNEDHPQSVRHIFYRMTDPRLVEPVEKSDRGYRHIQYRCTELRRSGRIPYNWIADMSRRGCFVNTFSDAGDFISRMAGLYRADLWELSDYQAEAWCESRSIASVIQGDCEELAVSLFPCGGFTSLSFAHSAAEQHNNSGDSRPLIVFYIGDHDPAGVLIDISLKKELRLHLKPEIDMHFGRIAINERQINEYDLPTKPRKKTDKRSQQIDFTVEAEAMPANILRSILRYEIENLLPAGALAAAKVAEESERNGLMILASQAGGTSHEY